ncbi:hypothetical protein VT06_15790 [Arsukibacterium sp. MJ3]|nr:hypothetical protein VT06_15790 [Arsukibacterium sp. MJ3]
MESLVDACRDAVQPLPGSVVYCDLAFGFAEHTGIYLGGGRIAHLNGNGIIESVDQHDFVKGTPSIRIVVSARNTSAVGCGKVAERARTMLGSRRRYNFILNNCHQFTAGCLTGDVENANSFLWMVKFEAEKKLRADSWRAWR